MNRDTILSLAIREQNANMQSTLRGYSSGYYENSSKGIQDPKFIMFTDIIDKILYYNDIVKDEQGNVILENISADDIGSIIEKINNQYSNKEYYNNSQVVFLCDSSIRIPKTMMHSDTGISFVSSLNDTTPCAIRITICERNAKGGSSEYINGYIDFCSNGEIKIGKFIKTTYTYSYVDSNNNVVIKEKEVPIEDSYINLESIENIHNYMMQIFDRANLISDIQDKSR